MQTIVVAEDNAVNRELIRELLECRGFAVIEASDGEEALQSIASCTPDLVLTDIHMPVLDGYGLVRRIRNDSALCALPVVALTAFAMEGDREKGLMHGFDGYVTKPVDSALLLGEIQRCLDPRKLPGGGSYLPTSSSSKTS
jgi:CheY-like chemotaxis protein